MLALQQFVELVFYHRSEKLAGNITPEPEAVRTVPYIILDTPAEQRLRKEVHVLQTAASARRTLYGLRIYCAKG
jgi:hypothetical protein